MSGRPLQLEAFSTVPAKTAAQSEAAIQQAAEAARIAGYDAGYKTGWDDAMRQSNEDGQRIGAEFARNLKDLSFTYHEARAHVLRSFEGLLSELVRTFLPELAARSLGPILKEEIAEIADAAVGAPILIRAAPAEAEKLRGLITDDAGMPIEIVEEESLAPGQAHLKLGTEERDVDLSAPLRRLDEALSALTEVTERTLDDRRYG